MTSALSTPLSALIVDDLRFNRTLLRHTLASLGYTTSEAVDGTEAITLLNRQTFTVVFLDWELPGGLKGNHVARYLRDQPAHADTLLIAITNDTSASMRQRCALAGTHAFLGKNLDSVSVHSAIELARAQRNNDFSQVSTVACIRAKLTDYARQFPGGMPEALRHCRDEFISEYQQLRLAMAATHWPDAARAAHNLGSLSSLLGLPQMREAAHACETVFRRVDIKNMQSTVSIVDTHVEKVCTALSEADSDTALKAPIA